MADPRNNPLDAYEAFMAMPDSEWAGLTASLLAGGVLTVAEQQGFEKAMQERPHRRRLVSATPDDIAEWQALVADDLTYLGLFEYLAARDAGEFHPNGPDDGSDLDYDERML